MKGQYYPRSIWRQFRKKKLALFAGLILVCFYIVVIFADFFAPYRYDEEDITRIWAPPTRVYFLNLSTGRRGFYVYDYKSSLNKYYQRIYSPDKSKVYPIKFFVHGFKYKLLGMWETDIHLFGCEGTKVYLLGTDLKGRDIFSRLIYGARISLSIGLIGVTISFLIGMIVGGIAGYWGGWVDNLLMRIVEMVMMIPGFYLMLALRASFPPQLSSTQVYLLIVIILSFIGWASIARVIRGMAISLRENEFILAAKSFGMSNLRIIIRHILPHTLSYTLVAIFLSIPGYIIGEAALSLLGLGIQEPEVSWGNMLALAQSIVTIQLYPWILSPGVMILIVTVCFNLIGDALRDILDPKREVF